MTVDPNSITGTGLTISIEFRNIPQRNTRHGYCSCEYHQPLTQRHQATTKTLPAPTFTILHLPRQIQTPKEKKKKREKKQHASPQPPSLPKFSLPAPTASSAPKTKTDLSTPRPSLVAVPPLFEPPSSNSTPASTTPFTTPTKSTGKPWTLAREACTIHHFHFEDLNDPEQML
ncbi:MAG: hypothetical protein Q9203_002274 [Teloschistes exilis]